MHIRTGGAASGSPPVNDTSQNVFTDTGVISAREIQDLSNTWPGYPVHVIVPSTHEISSTATHGGSK